MPLRRGDAPAADRQRQHGQHAGRGVGGQQRPVSADDQLDEDDERQRENRHAVRQVHQVGLGRGEHADDLGHRALERHPIVAGDQRTGDDDAQERRRQHDPEDLVGATGQRLQQAAGDADVTTVYSHGEQRNHAGTLYARSTTFGAVR